MTGDLLLVGHVRETQMHTRDVVPLCEEQRCGDGAVDTSGHGDEHVRHQSGPPVGARARRPNIASPERSRGIRSVSVATA
jgi:hypothetical protein